MKTREMSNHKTEELTFAEAVSINGGNPWTAFFIANIVIQIVTNPQAHIDAFMQGVREGYDAVQGPEK